MTSRDIDASEPPPSRLRLSLAVMGLAFYVSFVFAATLSPTPLDRGYESSINKLLAVLHRNGVPEWFGYTKLEFSANIVMFIPIGFLVALALPWKAWWLTIPVLPALSGVIEFTQGALLSERVSSVMDIVANTIGGYVGLAAAMLLQSLIHARDRRLIARALWNVDRAARRHAAG